MTLKQRSSLSLSKWLALLAVGVQLVLPLSVGLQIAARGTASALAVFDTELCRVGHSVASPVAGDDNQTADQSRSGTPDSHGANPAAECPLCLALQAMHAFTDTPLATLPAPTVSGKSHTVASHDTAAATAPTASYQSRAPPVMA